MICLILPLLLPPGIKINNCQFNADYSDLSNKMSKIDKYDVTELSFSLSMKNQDTCELSFDPFEYYVEQGFDWEDSYWIRDNGFDLDHNDKETIIYKKLSEIKEGKQLTYIPKFTLKMNC